MQMKNVKRQEVQALNYEQPHNAWSGKGTANFNRGARPPCQTRPSFPQPQSQHVQAPPHQPPVSMMQVFKEMMEQQNQNDAGVDEGKEAEESPRRQCER